VVSGGVDVVKYGNSNLVLNAANTYSGQTVVNSAPCHLAQLGTINNSPLVTVNPAATLDVTAKVRRIQLPSGQTSNMNGTVVGNLTAATGSTLLGSGVINGSLTVNSNAEVAIATTNVVGTTYVSNNVTLAGGHFTWELAPSFDISDGIVANGNLTLTGTNVSPSTRLADSIPAARTRSSPITAR
jgi:autotransporter-associated beta strand protein